MSDKSEVQWGVIHCFEMAGQVAAEQAGWIGLQWSRPSTVHRPTLMKDGNAWIALLGENIQEGVVGCGVSPSEAMDDFDRAFYAKEPQPTPAAPKVELVNTMEALRAAIEWMSDDGCDCGTDELGSCAICLCRAALAELNTAEGKGGE